MAELVSVVRDWTRSHYPREIIALVPLGATGCVILALIAIGPWVNGKFGYPGLVPLLIATGLTTARRRRIRRRGRLLARPSGERSVGRIFGVLCTLPLCSAGRIGISRYSRCLALRSLAGNDNS